MPPKSKPQPAEEERDRLVAWIDATLARTVPIKKDPGRVTMRRLNRAEYNNTIRDLVGVKFQPAEDFPSDDVGYGFDNIGDVLSLSPILLEKYLAAADKIVDQAFKSPELRKRIVIAEPGGGRSRAEASRTIIENFATRAYRRPIEVEEVKRLLGFAEKAEQNGDSFETGIQLAVKAMLVSPHFLFRVAWRTGPHPNPSPPQPEGQG